VVGGSTACLAQALTRPNFPPPPFFFWEKSRCQPVSRADRSHCRLLLGLPAQAPNLAVALSLWENYDKPRTVFAAQQSKVIVDATDAQAALISGNLSHPVRETFHPARVRFMATCPAPDPRGDETHCGASADGFEVPAHRPGLSAMGTLPDRR